MSNHILIKNYSVVGVHWGSYRQHDPAKIDEAWKALWQLYNAGRIKPVIGRRYPMHQVADAMELFASRSAVGKIVLFW